MNLIFTCGGTAGHINPAIAVANMMRERHPDCNILFIGAKGHMEEKLVPQAGYDLKCLEGSGLSRGKNLAAVKKNLHAVKCVREGVKACKKIFREFKPDVVIGTGGYASFPALYAAQSMGIPTCVHESNAVPGVTTKLAANKASRALGAFEESVRHYKHPEKVEVVGMPVRREFIFDTKEGARKELGLSGFVVVSAFGSQGAKVMNETIADMMPLAPADGFPFHHIHATGRYGVELLPRLLREKGVAYENNPNLDIREYIHDMPDCLAAADLVIARAGAITLAELTAVGRASVLIPSPNVAENHQYHNAMVLANHKAAVVIEEKDLTGEKLVAAVKEMTADPEKLREIGLAAKALGVPNACGHITDELLDLYKTHRK